MRDSSEENAYLSRGSTDGTVLPPRNDRHIAVHAGLEGSRVWDASRCFARRGQRRDAEDNRADELELAREDLGEDVLTSRGDWRWRATTFRTTPSFSSRRLR